MVHANAPSDGPQNGQLTAEEEQKVAWIISTLGFTRLVEGEREYFLKMLRKDKGDRYAARKRIARTYSITLKDW